MSTDDKATLVTGFSSPEGCNGNIGPIASLNFSGLCLQDGPLGIRLADLASAFPAGLTAGASWDKDLIYARALATASQFRAKGANIMLG